MEIKRAEPRTIQNLVNGGGQSHKDFSQPPPLSSEQQQQPPQSWGGAVIHQNGHHLGPPTAAVPPSVPPPAPQTIQINQIPSPNLNHHSTAYTPQYGSPPAGTTYILEKNMP